MARFKPYTAHWNGTPVYVLGTCRRRDEGEVGHDLRVRPVRLGKGPYTMVVAPDDVTPDAHHSTMTKSETVKLKDRYSGGNVWLTIRDGKVLVPWGSDPNRYYGMTIEQAKHHARYGGTPVYLTVKSPAQLEREIADALSTKRSHSKIRRTKARS